MSIFNITIGSNMTKKHRKKSEFDTFVIRNEGDPAPKERVHRSADAITRRKALEVYSDQRQRKAEESYWGDE